ncbi:ParB/RepB/Spo0J family partition protein [Brachybacterium hainanense]|uniref:ParB/RepB/Spo0J family partition protein n=1 Tax=Brachybacterium hainanense TaxID=1541174 RepID=A0ABV6RGE0_9MICO
MTQRRGLGRGLGALIPGAGAPSPQASQQDPELRTRRTAAPAEDEPGAESGPRPVDMFFSGDPLPAASEPRPRRRAGGSTDLAGAMARAAAERRSTSRGSSRRKTTSGATPATPTSPASAADASHSDPSSTGAERAATDAASPEETATAPTPATPKASAAAKTAKSRTASSSRSSTKTPRSGGAKAGTGTARTTKTRTTKSRTAGTGRAPAKAAASGETTSSSSTSAPAARATPVEEPASRAAATASANRSSTTASEAADSPASGRTGAASAREALAPRADAAPAAAPREDSPVVDVDPAELVPARPDAAAEASPAPAPSAEASASAPSEEDPSTPAPSAGSAVEDTALDAPATPASPAEPVEETPTPADEQVAAAVESPEADPPSPIPAEPAVADAGEPEEAAASEERDLVKVPGAEFAEIPIQEIRENPRNPRTMFDDDQLDELAFSLREVGVLQPVVVRSIPVTDDGESFELVMGERRWRAAQRAGLTSIPAIIRETSDDDLLRDALLENLHRSQLNPLEEAAAYQQLLEDFGCTQDELSSRIGRSRPQISNTLRLMRLPALVQRRLASGALSAGHARALLALEDPRLMEELAGRVVAEGLSVRAVERLVAGGAAPTGAKSTPRRTTYNPRVVDITSRLSNQLEAPVRIDVGKRKGKITLEFTNLDDLERLVERLGIEQDALASED